MIEFIIPGEPKAKQRPRMTKTGHTYTPKQTINYENWVRTCYLNSEYKFKYENQPLIAEITVFFSIPNSKSKKEKEAINQGKPTCDFINVSVFGKQAESCANYLSKGSMCCVNGRINTGSYTTQSGEKRYTTDVVSNRVEFIGSKQSASTMPGKPTNQDSNFFDDFPDDDNDVFKPVDEEDIPF